MTALGQKPRPSQPRHISFAGCGHLVRASIPLGQKIKAVEGIVPVQKPPRSRCAAIRMMQQRIASLFLFLAVANYTRKNRRSLR
jgi:hypothetical protein